MRGMDYKHTIRGRGAIETRDLPSLRHGDEHPATLERFRLQCLRVQGRCAHAHG